MISYRRIILGGVVIFLSYLLWYAIQLNTATSISAVWPLIFGLLITLMLPEKRLKGDLFVKLVTALKGKPDDG